MSLRHGLSCSLPLALLTVACATGIPFDGEEAGGGGAGAGATGQGAEGAGAGGTTGSTTSSTGSGTTTSTTTTSTTTTSTTTTSTTTTTTGGICAHDVCDEGVALDYGCGDPCVDTVCNYDDYCCDTSFGSWDDICVGEAAQLCGACGGGGSVLPGDLVISEIMNNPAAVVDTDGEWFEIYNDSAFDIDLQGMVIHHQAGDPNAMETITSSVIVPSGGYAVLGVNANAGTNGNVNVDYQYSTAVNLNNTSDYLAILDSNLTIIDEVLYDETSGLDPSGASRSLDPLFLSALDNDDDTFFCEASSTIPGSSDTGTPGSGNDSCI